MPCKNAACDEFFVPSSRRISAEYHCRTTERKKALTILADLQAQGKSAPPDLYIRAHEANTKIAPRENGRKMRN